MGTIASAFLNAFRDFVANGVPSSGQNEPNKSEIRAIGPIIETFVQWYVESQIGNAASANLLTIAKATRADLYADLGHPAYTIGLVYNDGANNGFYIKSGDEGAGAWALTAIPFSATVDIIANFASLLGYGTGTTQFFTDAEGFEYASLDETGFILPWGGLVPTTRGALVVTDPEGWVLFFVPFDGYAAEAAGATTATTIVRPWMGALTDTSIAFAADVEGVGPGVVEIEVSTDQHFTNIVSATPAKVATVTERSATQDWRSINQVVRGLEPDTSYWARFIVDGATSGDALTFKTAPERGAGAPYRFAVISCTDMRPGTDIQVHRAIASFDPLFVVHTGDLQYTNITTDNILLPRAQNTRPYRDNADVQGLTSKCPYFYVTDDHDTAANDCGWHSTYDFEAVARNTRRAWRETTPLDARMFPQISEGETDPDKLLETQQFDIANTRHLLLDTRSQNNRTEGTLLGNDAWAAYWNQLAWLKSALVQAGADSIDRVFLHVPIYWGAGAGEVNAYFTAERREISDYIRDTPGIPPVTIITGDYHALGIDDGGHSDFATGGGLATGLIMSSAAYRDTLTGTAGQWEWLGEDTFQALPAGEFAQYFIIVDVDAGGEWTIRFYGGPYTDTTPTLLGTYALSDGTPEIQFSGDTASAVAGSTASLQIQRTWISQANPISVDWSTSNGQGGNVAFRPNSKIATIPVTVPASGSTTVTLSSPSGGTLGATITLSLTAL